MKDWVTEWDPKVQSLSHRYCIFRGILIMYSINVIKADVFQELYFPNVLIVWNVIHYKVCLAVIAFYNSSSFTKMHLFFRNMIFFSLIKLVIDYKENDKYNFKLNSCDDINDSVDIKCFNNNIPPHFDMTILIPIQKGTGVWIWPKDTDNTQQFLLLRQLTSALPEHPSFLRNSWTMTLLSPTVLPRDCQNWREAWASLNPCCTNLLLVALHSLYWTRKPEGFVISCHINLLKIPLKLPDLCRTSEFNLAQN